MVAGSPSYNKTLLQGPEQLYSSRVPGVRPCLHLLHPPTHLGTPCLGERLLVACRPVPSLWLRGGAWGPELISAALCWRLREDSLESV